VQIKQHTHVWQRRTLEAFADALPQPHRVLNGLEELAVLTHALDAKRVVYTANLQVNTHSMQSYAINTLSCLPHST
jgi:hypothetical protein